MWRAIRAWPTISLMFFVGIFLIGITGPSFLESVNRGRSKHSLIAVRDAAVALERWREEHGAYPRSARQPLSAVLAREPGLRALQPPETDAWKHPLQYMGAGDAFVVWSLGKNGRDDIHPHGGAFEGLDVDFVIRNGVLWQGPDGL